jgi:hypothetical protein
MEMEKDTSMLHRVLVFLAVLGLALGAAGNAFAGFFSAPDSTFTFQLGGLAPITVGADYTFPYTQGGLATLTNNGTEHDMTAAAGIWQTASKYAGTKVGQGTSLFTGVALITDLVLTASNGTADFTASYGVANPVAGNRTGPSQTIYSGSICPTGCLGGTSAVSGTVVVKSAGAPFPVSLNKVGVGGTTILNLGGPVIQATLAPFVTGKVRITGITSNILQLPDRSPVQTGPGILLGATPNELVKTQTTMGAFFTTVPGTKVIEVTHTVTLSGTNQLASASQAGQVTLVSPLRVATGAIAGTIPGFVKQTFAFVPEPGTLLLLASGAAGLVVLGRRRTRR